MVKLHVILCDEGAYLLCLKLDCLELGVLSLVSATRAIENTMPRVHDLSLVCVIGAKTSFVAQFIGN